MGATADRLTQLREASLAEAAQLVFRKAIYRKVEMSRFESAIGSGVPPQSAPDLNIELWGPERFEEVMGTNPYLTEVDVRHFSEQSSTCIVALDHERIVATCWMTNGHVYVSELGRWVDVPPNEHYACRFYVNPGYRGRALTQHMVYRYAVRLSPEDRIWGLVYRDNTSSIRSFEHLGGRQTGEYWTRYVFGKQFSGQRRFPPRPATTLPSAS